MAAPILIVDDDPDIRESLGDMLSHEGYRVQTVPDGSEALSPTTVVWGNLVR